MEKMAIGKSNRKVKIMHREFFLFSLLYLALPILIFFFAWLRLYIALPCALLLAGSIFYFYKDSLKDNKNQPATENYFEVTPVGLASYAYS